MHTSKIKALVKLELYIGLRFAFYTSLGEVVDLG